MQKTHFAKTLRPVRLTMAAAAFLVVAAPAMTQENTDRRYATRAELEAQAAEAERSSSEARRNEARQIRERLRDGDFQTGDRIVLAVTGQPTLTDTFAVRAGRTLLLPNLPEISLNGVLRSELGEFMTQQLGRFVRNPTVRAESLVRVAVMGAVTRPGFYSIPADLLLSDAIMVAGGPAGNAEPKRTVVRRSGTELLEGKEVQTALTAGRTLDQLNIRAGDEIVVGQKSGLNWSTALQGLGIALGLVGTIVALGN
jgi:hypothetical protein